MLRAVWSGRHPSFCSLASWLVTVSPCCVGGRVACHRSCDRSSLSRCVLSKRALRALARGDALGLLVSERHAPQTPVRSRCPVRWDAQIGCYAVQRVWRHAKRFGEACPWHVAGSPPLQDSRR